MRTGYYLRVQRDGRYQNLDIAEMSDDELISISKAWDAARLLSWVLTLKNFIKDVSPIEVYGPREL